MTRLRFDDVSRALPDLAELRPVLDHLLAGSEPDPDRRWSASGELETAGSRLVDPGPVERTAGELAASEAEHLEEVYGAVLRAVARIRADDPSGAAEALLEAAAREEGRNRASRAEAYAASAVRMARTARDQSLVARALRRQARALRALGRLSDAATRYREGHVVAVEAGDAAGGAEGAIGLGNVLEEQGRWGEAREWYHRALDLIEFTDEPPPELWHALLNLHVVTRSLGEVEESVEWIRRAEEVASVLGDTQAPAVLHNAWGQLHMAQGDFESASRRFREALAAEAGAWARVNFRLNLGEALLARGDPLEAAEEVREAEREALVSGVTSKLPEVYRLLGRIAAARGNAEAMVLFERALDLVRERDLPLIEEAVTLQAYAEELRDTDPERSRALRDRALGLYRELGIPGMRDAWAESYATARDLLDTDEPDREGRHYDGHGGHDEG